MVYVMNVLSTIFSFLCHQNPARSFYIDGMLLPLCQRCTGLYVGMGISFIWLIANRYYKKGLPPRIIIYVNIASVLIMGVFGYHLLDPGPGWRLWSGLIFGNAVAYLVLPGSWFLCNNGRIDKSNSKLSTLSFFVLFAFINTIPFWFPIQSVYFHCLILTLITIGLLCVPYCIVSIIIFVIRKFAVSPILKGFRNECAQ